MAGSLVLEFGGSLSGEHGDGLVRSGYNEKMFGPKIRYLQSRKGERFASALTDMNLSSKVYKYFGSVKIKEYIEIFKQNHPIK